MPVISSHICVNTSDSLFGPDEAVLYFVIIVSKAANISFFLSASTFFRISSTQISFKILSVTILSSGCVKRFNKPINFFTMSQSTELPMLGSV